MRVSWEPAASTPRNVALSGGGSCSSSFNGAVIARKRESLPTQGNYPCPMAEVQQLRVEVGRLRASAQSDAKERETLHDMIGRLKTELRHALDENRALTDSLEERKQLMDDQSAKREAAARESALNSAKELFKSMLEDAEGSRAGAENRNMNREHAKASLSSHKRRPFGRASTAPAAPESAPFPFDG